MLKKVLAVCSVAIVCVGCDDTTSGTGGASSATSTGATQANGSTGVTSSANSTGSAPMCPQVAGTYSLTEVAGNPMDCADMPELTVTQTDCTLTLQSSFGVAEGPIGADGKGEAHALPGAATKSDATYTFTGSNVECVLTPDPSILDVVCSYTGTKN